MGDFEGCPSCEKPVMGRTALLAHLEFSHDIDDPVAYLLELDQPARPTRFGRLKRSERRTRSERPKGPRSPAHPERVPPPARSAPEPSAPEPSASGRVDSPERPETSERPELQRAERFKRPEHPERTRRDRRPLLTWGSGALVAVAVVVAGVLAMTGSSAEGPTDGVPVAAGESASVDSPPEDAPPATDPSPPTTATNTAPSTAPPPTTDAPPPPTTSVPPTTRPASGAVALESFRKPFLLDAHVVTCAASAPEDVYTVGFTLSGAREIILDGEAFPGRTGDGDHELRHAVPAGSTNYLDRITVLDGGGTEHSVDVSPPLYLGGCSA